MAKEPLDTSEMIESADDFAAAYKSHAKGVHRFLYWRTQDAALSEDLTSSVFEKAWRSRSSFHGGSAQAWLYRIARNLLTDHWRKKKDIAVENVQMLPEAVVDETATTDIDRAFAADQLKIALHKLPEHMQTIIELRFIRELPVGEVAAQLGITEGNVRVIQYRALRKLRSHLK